MVKNKFPDLFKFFEGVEELLKLKNMSSIDLEDIGYQQQFSKQTLRAMMERLEKSFEKGN